MQLTINMLLFGTACFVWQEFVRARLYNWVNNTFPDKVARILTKEWV